MQARAVFFGHFVVTICKGAAEECAGENIQVEKEGKT